MEGFVRACTVGVMASAVLLSSGCSMGWKEGWRLDRAKATSGTADVDALRQAARDADANASDRKGVEALAAAWTAVLKAVPDDYEALCALSSADALLAAAYPRTIGEKGELYRKALQNAERAMALDEGFRRAVEGGARTWDAARSLPAARVDAMAAWALAANGMYVECLSGVVQETNRKWIARIDAVLDRIEALAPGYGQGLAPSLKGIVAAAMPARAGGDAKRAEALFGTAVDAGPGALRNRWARAKHLWTGVRDEARFREDLQWVVSREPGTVPGGRGWDAFYRRDAADLLAHPPVWF